MTLTPKNGFINMGQTETADTLKHLTYTVIYMNLLYQVTE